VSGAGSAAIGRVLARARTALGLPYCFAGGTADGPSHGVGGLGCAGSMIGFDCSGLALFAYAGIGVTLPHYAAAQYRYGGGRHVPLASVEPGDLVFLSADGTPAGIHHVAIIWSVYSGTGGAGQVIEAQDFGVPVHVRDWLGSREAGVLPEALRITPPTTATTPTAPPR
jgi:cell wall-associated NlpC family hydrolase